MSRLVRVELSRFFSRRAMRVFGMLLLLAVLLAGTLTFVLSHRDIEGATRAARVAAAEEHAMCEQDPESKGGCGELDLSQIAADPRFHLAGLPGVFRGISAAFVMLGLGLGASFVGAEWSHRTMTSLLTWEPCRLRVAAAKFVAVASAVFLSVMAFEVLLGGALVPAAVFRGTTSGVDGAWLGDTIGVAVKGATLASMGAVLGAAVASVTRSSALALGIAFGWLAVGENMVRNLRPNMMRWLIGDNAVSFIAPSPDAPRSAFGGAVVVTVYVLAAAVIATRVFRRHDLA